MRYLARTSRSLVSRWMSLARRSMAPRISESTRRTIGLSSGRRPRVAASRLVVGERAAGAAPSLACSRSISPPRCRFSAAATRLAGAMTASTGRASRNSISSSFSSSGRSPKARTRSRPAGPRGRRQSAPAARAAPRSRAKGRRGRRRGRRRAGRAPPRAPAPARDRLDLRHERREQRAPRPEVGPLRPARRSLRRRIGHGASITRVAGRGNTPSPHEDAERALADLQLPPRARQIRREPLRR